MRSLTCGLAVALAACNGREPAAPSRPAPSDAAPVEARDRADPELLDPGAEPRVVLRYRVPPGTRRALELEYELMPPIPTMSIAGTIEVTTVTDGVLTMRTTYSDTAVRGHAGTSAADLAAVDENLATVRGVVFVTRMTDRGRSLGGAVEGDAPPAVHAMVATLADSTSGAIFPVEPVGVGARWRVVQPHALQGIDGELVDEWTLEAIDGDRIRLRSVQTAKGPLPPVEGGDVSFDGRGTVVQTVDLATYERELVTEMHITGMFRGTAVDMRPRTVERHR